MSRSSPAGAVFAGTRSAAPTERYGRLDALRGGAMIWMAGFHFAFDLNHFGYLQQDFYVDPLWTVQRTCILSLFLFCAGGGMAVARARGVPWPTFWKRWAQVVACALLVSAGSWSMYPDTFIYFGVLHGMAVMLLIARLAAPAGRALWVAGVAAMLLPSFVADRFFDTRLTDWVGLVTRKPYTEDYVPVFPWLGVMLLGVAAFGLIQAKRPAMLRGAASGVARWLAALGRWPLSFYMLHQPVLIGLLTAFAVLRHAPR